LIASDHQEWVNNHECKSKPNPNPNSNPNPNPDPNPNRHRRPVLALMLGYSNN